MVKVILLAMPGTTELLLILGAVVFLFGGKKIPELMKGLGRGINEFKKAKDEITTETQELAQKNKNAD